MSSFKPIVDEEFREYADLELRCHTLFAEGKDSDPEIPVAEDRMTLLWVKLDETQRRSLSGMGSDLNWVRRNCTPPPKGRKSPAEVSDLEQQELVAAIGSKEWYKVLHYLRLCAPVFPEVALASHRGRIYEAIGMYAYASVFYGVAADGDQSNADAGLKALETLQKTNSAKAIQRADTIVASPFRNPPGVVAVAAAMILQHAEKNSRPIDRPRFSTLLSNAVNRLQLEPAGEARTVAYQALAAGFDVVGDQEMALQCLDDGLADSPNNDDLLVLKGILLYGSKPQQAIEVFESLVRKDMPNAWPYAFLAHVYLQKGAYEVSLGMSRKAWELGTTNTMKAQLLEWQAICQAELRYPIELIRATFREAIALDASNVTIADNREAFENAVSNARQIKWRDIEKSSLPQRVAGMRESFGVNPRAA